jgi:stalled ribosome rescue protein Dom34
VSGLKRRKYKRGYLVAILIGLEKDKATLWRIYSNVAKHQKSISLKDLKSDSETSYNFNESIVDALRPILKEGVHSVIIASPPRTSYSKELLAHIRLHHAWLNQGNNKVVFSEIEGTAGTPPQVAALTRTNVFHEIVEKTTQEETEDLVELLDKRLNLSKSEHAVLFSLEEAETVVIKNRGIDELEPELILLTDNYLRESSSRNRLNRLLQIASNKNVKTRIIDSESPAGKRLAQFGGLACLMKESRKP